jgi:predicted RNA-binding Zn ribbon-like protein
MTEVAAPATRRYGVLPAAGSASFAQGLVNTKSIAGVAPDLLDDLDSANTWLSAATHHRPAPRLTAKDLPRLRELRADVEALIDGDGAALADPAEATVAVLSGARPVLAPRGTGWKWVRAAVLCGVYDAVLTGTWNRLRLCRNHTCRAAFYDRSKNNSAVWHDVNACGNAINLRASRARRRTAP